MNISIKKSILHLKNFIFLRTCLFECFVYKNCKISIIHLMIYNYCRLPDIEKYFIERNDKLTKFIFGMNCTQLQLYTLSISRKKNIYHSVRKRSKHIISENENPHSFFDILLQVQNILLEEQKIFKIGPTIFYYLKIKGVPSFKIIIMVHDISIKNLCENFICFL